MSTDDTPVWRATLLDGEVIEGPTRCTVSAEGITKCLGLDRIVRAEMPRSEGIRHIRRHKVMPPSEHRDVVCYEEWGRIAWAFQFCPCCGVQLCKLPNATTTPEGGAG